MHARRIDPHARLRWTLLACGLAVGCSPVPSMDDVGPGDAGVPVDAYDGTGDGAAQRSCQTPGTPGCGLVAIAGATFTIGEPPMDGGAFNASPPQTDITVDGFQMDRFEVTKARFAAFWDAGHPAPPDASVAYPGGRTLAFVGVVAAPLPPSGVPECNWVLPDRDEHPINCIDWPTAQAFCVWDGGRLPTAAEWELAARGVADRRFPWGDEPLPDDLHACGRDTGGTCPVGSRPLGVTPDGLYDMAGNVREWNADWYMPYTDTTCWGGVAQTNPLCDVQTMAAHDVVGGSWVNNLQPEWLHPATRYWGDGAYAPGEGLRCAR